MRIVMHNESVKRINSSLEEEKKQKEDRMLNTYAHKMNERERKLQLKNKEMNDISKRIREGIKNKDVNFHPFSVAAWQPTQLQKMPLTV